MLYSKMVNEILDKNDIDSYPIDILKICKNEGFKVFAKSLENNISGYILIKNDEIEDYGTNKVIFVNSNHTKTRQMFTIAHELAHYYLHKNENSEYFAHRFDDNDTINKQIEREANSFASILLMPDSLLVNEVQNYRNTYYGITRSSLIRHVAKEFAVSSQVSETRLKEKWLL